MLPTFSEGFAGVIAIETSVPVGAAVTVKVVVPCTAPEVAVIVAVPAASALASPAVLMVAKFICWEPQVTLEVKFCVLPSLKVPVAMYCTVKPAGTVPLAGVTAMETSAGMPAVTVVEPQTVPVHALTVEEPEPTA